MIFYDTESVGLTGPTTLIQWARATGRVRLVQVFATRAKETLRLIEMLMATGVCAWNIEHDHWHLQRLHNVLSLHGANEVPTKASWLAFERAALDGPCLKPKTALDLFLHCKKGPLQSLMERDAIRVRRVPAALAGALAAELGRRVEIEPIYFARRASGHEWQVDTQDDEEFPNVVLRFGARFGLKPVARFLLNRDYPDIPVPKDRQPGDLKDVYDPFNRLWIDKFDWQVEHWATNAEALDRPEREQQHADGGPRDVDAVQARDRRPLAASHQLEDGDGRAHGHGRGAEQHRNAECVQTWSQRRRERPDPRVEPLEKGEAGRHQQSRAADHELEPPVEARRALGPPDAQPATHGQRADRHARHGGGERDRRAERRHAQRERGVVLPEHLPGQRGHAPESHPALDGERRAA